MNQPTAQTASPAQQEDDPIRDPERLKEIVRLDLFNDEVDELLDRQAQKAAEKVGMPQGMVTLVLDEAQYFAGQHGLEEGSWMEEANGSPVEWSFCQYTVRDDDEFVVGDATKNERVKDSPLTQEGQRCYAGIPLRTSRGHVLGSFCVSGDETHHFTDEDLDHLRALADETMQLIEARVAEA